MKILITGGLGLIGHNVTAKLEAKEHDVVIVDRELGWIQILVLFMLIIVHRYKCIIYIEIINIY
jgi:dTDP-D-glucose 4,6-dehydratase